MSIVAAGRADMTDAATVASGDAWDGAYGKAEPNSSTAMQVVEYFISFSPSVVASRRLPSWAVAVGNS